VLLGVSLPSRKPAAAGWHHPQHNTQHPNAKPQTRNPNPYTLHPTPSYTLNNPRDSTNHLPSGTLLALLFQRRPESEHLVLQLSVRHLFRASCRLERCDLLIERTHRSLVGSAALLLLTQAGGGIAAQLALAV